MDENTQCPNCGSKSVRETRVSHTFQYGSPLCMVNVPVTEPVMHCDECSEEWTDYRGEEARTEATIHALYQEVKALHAFKRGVEEALNSGDSTYRLKPLGTIVKQAAHDQEGPQS